MSASADSALAIEQLEYTDHGKSGSELESSLDLRLTSTRSGNPVPGYPVYFAVTGGNAELLPAEGYLTLSGELSEGLIVETDSNGIARVGLSLGKMGEVAVTGTVTDHDGVQSSVTFHVVSLDIQAIVFQIFGGLAIFSWGCISCPPISSRLPGTGCGPSSRPSPGTG